jgi:hypothetical protein
MAGGIKIVGIGFLARKQKGTKILADLGIHEFFALRP